jgi:hypothetical protein
MGQEDRIVTEIGFSYKATNSVGVDTIELKPTTLIIRDQSPESASGHLVAIMGGLLGPAKSQVGI